MVVHRGLPGAGTEAGADSSSKREMKRQLEERKISALNSTGSSLLLLPQTWESGNRGDSSNCVNNSENERRLFPFSLVFIVVNVLYETGRFGRARSDVGVRYGETLMISQAFLVKEHWMYKTLRHRNSHLVSITFQNLSVTVFLWSKIFHINHEIFLLQIEHKKKNRKLTFSSSFFPLFSLHTSTHE